MRVMHYFGLTELLAYFIINNEPVRKDVLKTALKLEKHVNNFNPNALKNRRELAASFLEGISEGWPDKCLAVDIRKLGFFKPKRELMETLVRHYAPAGTFRSFSGALRNFWFLAP